MRVFVTWIFRAPIDTCKGIFNLVAEKNPRKLYLDESCKKVERVHAWKIEIYDEIIIV